MEMHWPYAKVIRWIDGDTVVLLIDTGFHNSREQTIRLVEVQAPEKRQPGYWNALNHVNAIAPTGAIVSVTTYKADGWDRYLGDVVTDQGVHVHADLLEKGLAVLYRKK